MAKTKISDIKANQQTKAEIMKRAKDLKANDLEEFEERQKQIIAEADENFFIDRMLDLNKDQLHNTRIVIKRLTKEGQLLRNIKKKWNS